MHTFSASQIIKYMSDPWLWVMKSLFKMKEPMNPYAIKGIVFGDFVETAAVKGHWDGDGIVELIKNRISDDCLKAGCEIPSLSNIEQDWLAARDYFKSRENKGYDKPIKNQHEFIFESKHGKVKGYIDLLYPRAVMDIKYRSEVQKDNRCSDMIQLACYWKATGHRQFLLEICKGKVKQSAYGQEELEPYWKIAEHNMSIMSGIIDRVKDIRYNNPDYTERCVMLGTLGEMPIHNPDGFWWPEALKLREEILG